MVKVLNSYQFLKSTWPVRGGKSTLCLEFGDRGEGALGLHYESTESLLLFILRCRWDFLFCSLFCGLFLWLVGWDFFGEDSVDVSFCGFLVKIMYLKLPFFSLLHCAFGKL